MKLSYCNEYAANANIREYLNQDIRNGKLVIFFQGYQKKMGKSRQKVLITKIFTSHKNIFLAEAVWLSGMF